MPILAHNPSDVFPPYRAYCHGMEVRGESRLLFISGLNGYMVDGKTMPDSFEEQADLIWGHIQAILASAGMQLTNIVSLRTYLADPAFDDANVRMRASLHGESHAFVYGDLLPTARSPLEARDRGRRCHVNHDGL